MPQHGRPARVGKDEGRQHLEQGRFSGTVRPEEPEEFPFVHVEVDVREGEPTLAAERRTHCGRQWAADLEPLAQTEDRHRARRARRAQSRGRGDERHDADAPTPSACHATTSATTSSTREKSRETSSNRTGIRRVSATTRSSNATASPPVSNGAIFAWRTRDSAAGTAGSSPTRAAAESGRRLTDDSRYTAPIDTVSDWRR